MGLVLVIFVRTRYVDDPWLIIYRFSWLDKKQKKPINPVNNDNKCFQYAAAVALNHETLENIKKEYQKLNFYKQIELEKNSLTIRKKWLGKFWKNNQKIVLNVLYVKNNEYVSCLRFKHNSSQKIQIILSIFQTERDDITLQENIMSASLREITSKDEGDFHFRIVFIRSEQKANWNRLWK